MPHGGLDITGIAASARERLDALRAARGVVDRPQHEMESPQDLVGGQFRQALAQRRDERAAGLVEVVGDELRKERRVFGRQHGAQAGVLDSGPRRPGSRRGRGGRTPRSRTRAAGRCAAPRSATADARRSAWCSAVGTPRRAGRPCRGSSTPPATSSRPPRRQSSAPRLRRSRVRRTSARRRPAAARVSRRWAAQDDVQLRSARGRAVIGAMIPPDCTVVQSTPIIGRSRHEPSPDRARLQRPRRRLRVARRRRHRALRLARLPRPHPVPVVRRTWRKPGRVEGAGHDRRAREGDSPRRVGARGRSSRRRGAVLRRRRLSAAPDRQPRRTRWSRSTARAGRRSS